MISLSSAEFAQRVVKVKESLVQFNFIIPFTKTYCV